MMNFVDDGNHNDSDEDESDSDGDEEFGVQPHVPKLVESKQQLYCQVCKLEEKWRKDAGLKDVRGQSSRTQRSLAVCSHPRCSVRAHYHGVKQDRLR